MKGKRKRVRKVIVNGCEFDVKHGPLQNLLRPRGWKPRFGGAYFLPQPWHHVSMRPHTITLCLLATPALADLAGVASVKRAALAAYAEHLLGIVA